MIRGGLGSLGAFGKEIFGSLNSLGSFIYFVIISFDSFDSLGIVGFFTLFFVYFFGLPLASLYSSSCFFETSRGLGFWYYVSDATKCGPVRVELSSAGKADVNEYSWQLTGLSNGWNKIDLKMSTSTKVGTLDLSAINWFRIYDSKSGSITTRIDAIEVYNSDLNAIEDLKFAENEISVYPNPVQNQLNIKFLSNNWSNLDLILYDISGKVLIHKTVNSVNAFDNRLDVSLLKNGLYFLKITFDRKTITRKINIGR